MNNAVFGNIKVLNLRYRKKDELISIRAKLSYCKMFHRIPISQGNEKTQILMNKPVYLGISLLELSKILMCEFWYDYVKQKCSENTKLYYGFIAYIKTNDIYKYLAEDTGKRIGTLNYKLDRPLPKEENKNVIDLTKISLGIKIMIKIFGLRVKTYGNLRDDGS